MLDAISIIENRLFDNLKNNDNVSALSSFAILIGYLGFSKYHGSKMYNMNKIMPCLPDEIWFWHGRMVLTEDKFNRYEKLKAFI